MGTPAGRLFLWCVSTALNLRDNPLIGLPQLALSLVVVPALTLDWMGQSILSRVLHRASEPRQLISSPDTKTEAEMSEDNIGVCLLEGIYQLHRPASPKYDVVFFTTRDNAPSNWATPDNRTHWPATWLPEDLPGARILEARHGQSGRWMRPFDIAINLVNALKSPDVRVGSRPYFLVSSGLSNDLVASMVVRDTMRSILPACKGIAMYGGSEVKDVNDDQFWKILLDYKEHERNMNTITFLGADDTHGGLCSANTIHITDASNDKDLTRLADKKCQAYVHLVSFISRAVPPPDTPENAATPMLVNTQEDAETLVLTNTREDAENLMLMNTH